MSSIPTTTDEGYRAVQASEDFQTLRKKFRGFVFPTTAFFLAWYFVYVFLSIFAPGFMGTKAFGNITIEFDPLAYAIGLRLDGVQEH